MGVWGDDASWVIFQILKKPAYEVFRCKILKFLALADGATQRASRLAKRWGGGLGDVDKKIQ